MLKRRAQAWVPVNLTKTWQGESSLQVLQSALTKIRPKCFLVTLTAF